MKMQSFKIRLFEAIMIFLLSLIFSMNSAFGDVILTTVSDNKVLKLDSSGNVIWAKDIGYPVLTATEDPIDGSVYVGTGDWIDRIIKLDSNGQILWNEVYSFSPIPLYRVYSIVVDQDDGNIYASSSCYYGKLLKIDPLGNLIWVRGRGHIPYDTFPNDLPQISIDPTDGNIYGISYWNTFDVWGTLYKFDTNGNHIWTKPVEVGYGCNTGTVAVNPKDRNVYVGGRLSVYNLDSNGNIIWETPIAVETRGLAVDSSDDSVYVGGYASNNNITVGKLYKLNSAGAIIWDKDIDPMSSQAIAVNPSDGSVYYGVSNLLYKVDPDGNLIWEKEFANNIRSVSISVSISNTQPIANAGENATIYTEDIATTIIQGTATDENPDDVLKYRWMEGETVLLDWSFVSENGECPLDLGSILIEIGSHFLTLEVTDGKVIATDEMILTIENSAPNAEPTGGGVYEIYTEVVLGGYVSDFDGDMINYQWIDGTDELFSGSIQTIAGGNPVKLQDYIISTLSPGLHTIKLQVNDGTNDPVSHDITIEIVYILNIPRGWSMISLPIVPDDSSVSTLFPDAVVVYEYQKGIGYVQVTGEKGLEVGRGYWILFNEETSCKLMGQPFNNYSLSLSENGWRMLGGCTYNAKASVDNGNIGVIFEYVPGYGYKRINESESIEPGKGYWMLINNIVDLAVLRVDTVE